MTATNGKTNGHDRPPFAEPIREQGPDNYLALRERIERQKAAEPVRTVEGKPLLTEDEEREAHRFGKVTGIGFGAAKELLQETKARRANEVPPAVAQALAGRCADATLPAGMAPPVDLSLVLLGAIADTTGSSLRVERDPRDERHYITTAFDGTERPVEVPPAVARGVASILGAWVGTAGDPSDMAEAVKQGVAAVKTAKTSKPFPMPGTSWRWLGDKASEPQPHGPKTVASLRWFCGRVEAMFDDGESCAGVEHMMTVAAWECVKTPKATAVDPLRPNGHTGEEGRLVARLLAGTTDVENDGDRGPRLPSKATLSPREVFARAAAALPDEWIPVATWILQRLPTLRETVQARTNALAETVDRNVPRHDDADKRPTSTREEMALASLWRAVLDVSRLIDPHRDVRRGGAR